VAADGWQRLVAGWPWFRGAGRFPIPAYSEFMPPPYVVRKPYGAWEPVRPAEDDPWGWPVSEYEEILALRPGLRRIAAEVVGRLVALGRGKADHGIPPGMLDGNPAWPAELARRAGKLGHERYVVLLPLALSLTEDDKGRFRWTLFGGSEQGPARPFWQSFFTAPGREAPSEAALAFVRRLLGAAYGEPEAGLADLRRTGFRVLPMGDAAAPGREGPLPGWTEPFLLGSGLQGVKYLLTFRPFERLPPPVRRAYLAGDLHLLPFPGSLLFWGATAYHRLRLELPLAGQVPLLLLVERCEALAGIRVPQSGWLTEPGAEGEPADGRHGKPRNTYRRTHRYARVRRDEDELTDAREDRLAHVLFSTAPKDVGLYHKPMARNVQLWTDNFRLLLDGPRASRAEIRHAGKVLEEGGSFGYRFVFPAMRVGEHEMYWHRPVAAFVPRRAKEPVLLHDAPTGYLTAYRADQPDLLAPVELWPRLLHREGHAANLRLFAHVPDDPPHATLRNVRKLLDARQALGRPLPRSFARRLLTLPRRHTLDGWLASLPGRASDTEAARRLVAELERSLEPPSSEEPPATALTFGHTARRSFEVAYWKAIATLSAGDYVHKNNADPSLDPVTRKALPDERRDLEALGDYLLAHHTRVIAEHGLAGEALAGELAFRWETDFDFAWMGGWLANQQGRAQERNLVVVIPGRDRSRAVLMADHYDTAYKWDRYEGKDGDGARVAAPGADDNASATAALMLASPVLLELSKAGKLGCDVWLVHLTGEEFPAEGLGARRLAQGLVEGGLELRLPDGGRRDLSGVRVKGAFVLDMVAHNGNTNRDVFQISPGVGRESLWLAYQAHLAAEAWNARTQVWNRRPGRRGKGRGRRSRNGELPPTAAHLRLAGEVRPHDDPNSTLYNSDGQTLSDAGVPVVLFMEDYDIGRTGYHDSRDTLPNINLDYGAALAAVAIETVARAATEEDAVWGLESRL
jgi:hypothetical protein